MKHKTLATLHAESLKREQSKKPVRINEKITIFVNQNIPDQEARDTYFMKLADNERRHDTKVDRTRNAYQKNIEL
jgi:hypothetical protein